MKLPRDVSGDRLIRALPMLGYEVLRQKGSHARLHQHQVVLNGAAGAAKPWLRFGGLELYPLRQGKTAPGGVAVAFGDTGLHVSVPRHGVLKVGTLQSYRTRWRSFGQGPWRLLSGSCDNQCDANTSSISRFRRSGRNTFIRRDHSEMRIPQMSGSMPRQLSIQLEAAAGVTTIARNSARLDSLTASVKCVKTLSRGATLVRARNALFPGCIGDVWTKMACPTRAETEVFLRLASSRNRRMVPDSMETATRVNSLGICAMWTKRESETVRYLGDDG